MENKEKYRLIEVLMKRYPQNSRSNLKKLIEHHCVKVNGQILSKATEMVTLTDDIQLVKQEQNPLKILYEDQDMVVIDKPAGLLSMANDKEKENTAVPVPNFHSLKGIIKYGSHFHNDPGIFSSISYSLKLVTRFLQASEGSDQLNISL